MKKSAYNMSKTGMFQIDNFNYAKPLANFFPGMAGAEGIPLWAFYVNRGQCISSFGARDKNHAILEFLPANKAWELTATHGFRTFLRITARGKVAHYEPFRPDALNSPFTIKNTMAMSSYDLVLTESNKTVGIDTTIEYFPIPQDNYAGLARQVTIKNTSSHTKTIDMIDGLPRIIPCSTADFFLKILGRTIEAWMHIDYLKNGVPFVKLDVDPADRPEVVHFEEGNFYCAFHYSNGRKKLLPAIVDPEHLFSTKTDFSYPDRFFSATKLVFPKKQAHDSKTPSAFFPLTFDLSPGEEKTLFAIIGMMRSKSWAENQINRISTAAYFDRKGAENKAVITALQKDILTRSNEPAFDHYAQQTYLDNIARGGYPVIFKTGKNDTVVHMYSRKHGDLERDYNSFLLEPNYFSQGNGNYRDLNQNRRCDLWFHPGIKEENITTFLNLLQTDGYNPLVVKNADFFLTNSEALNEKLKSLIPHTKQREAIHQFVTTPFTPGTLLLFCEEHKISLPIATQAFLELVLACCGKVQQADHGEGFWTDHWSYNTDAIEVFASVYPEKLEDLLFHKKTFTFYDNDHITLPRDKRYILRDGKVRQFNAVVCDEEKQALIASRSEQPHTVRTRYGKGTIYKTTLIVKLLCLVANKIATLDPAGIGIEMEADKPNWYDALNGLPGLLGSSVCETMELKRLINLLIVRLSYLSQDKVPLTEELAHFIKKLSTALAADHNAFSFWDRTHSIKEAYREKTKLGFNGHEICYPKQKLILFLKRALKKVSAGIAKAYDKKCGVYHSYFINEVITYTEIPNGFVRAKKFRQHKLPFFLEGNVHALRIMTKTTAARNLHQSVKKSALYDRKLKMYKVNTALATMPEGIGRCRVFTPGWLENESIWLHMEYKYLLELLKRGLYEEFYTEFRNVLVPFLNPETYGRSILENVSFIVSSAFPDPRLHGNGFVARLSGSTAEFLAIWLIMNIGHEGFTLTKDNKVQFSLKPLLPGWLFTKKEKTYTFNLFSTIPVTYHNPLRKNTFGPKSVRPDHIVIIDELNTAHTIIGDTIPAPHAQAVRDGMITKIDVYLQ